MLKVKNKDTRTTFGRNDRSMLRWILKFRVEDKTTTEMLYYQLHLSLLSSTIRLRRLRWFGHIESSTN